MQLFLHGVHTLLSSVVLFYPSCCLPLNLSSAVMLLAVKGSQAGLAYSSTGHTNALTLCMLHFLAFHLWSYVASEEAQGLVGFVADPSDMNVPSEVRGDLNSEVFCHGFCAQCDCGAGTLMGKLYDIR